VTARAGVGRMESVDEIQYRMDMGSPKPRPRLYKGIEFRSSLEVRFAHYLDGMNEPWAYEPRVYGSPGHGYLPDFEMTKAGQPTFIEVKPTLAEVAAAQDKMSVIWDTHPDALLIVAVEERRTFYACLARSGRWTWWQERWRW
jgi:hypothetical protein